MKNLLIYINPRKDFDEETKTLVKVQIDSSLSLGWKRQDLMLLTNFPYEYGGIDAMVVPDDLFCDFSLTQAKINGIVFLFEHDLIRDEIYYCHDFDHYQLVFIPESEIQEKLGSADMGLTDYGRIPRWHTAGIFFKKGAEDIFKLLQETVYKDKIHNEEDALFMLTENNTNGIADRVQKLNCTYNYQQFNIRSTYPMADKPIRAVHFHPDWETIDIFFYGKNKINTPLAGERLIKIFREHGIA